MIEKIWLQHHIHTTPTSITVGPDETLASMFYHTCEENEACAAITQDNTTLSYGDLMRHSHAFAAYLLETWHLKKGDRIAVLLPNVLAFPVILFGAWQAGLIVVPVNPFYTTREMKKILIDAEISAVVVIESSADKIAEISTEMAFKTMVVRYGDLSGILSGWLLRGYVQHVARKIPQWEIKEAVLFTEALKIGEEEAFHLPNLKSDDLALIQYTAGTTGEPKGAMLSHGNLLANIKQLYAVIYDIISVASEPIRVITPLPLYHIYSLTANLLVFTYIGGHNILILDPRRMHSFIQALQKWPPMFITGVSTLYSLLLQYPKFSQLDLSTLKAGLVGGMKLQADVAARWHTMVGIPLSEGYGLTEASPVLLSNDLHAPEYTGVLGKPLISTEIKVCDDDGREVAVGEIGELYAKGPQVMQGYWRNPDETQKVLTVEGWLKTGDLVKQTATGDFAYVARKGDIINISGFKVSPHEIEAVVISHPGVKEAAVLGVPDTHRGTVIHLYVVRQDPNLTEHLLHAFCAESLSSYKVPSHIHFVETIPKNAVGKIMYRNLSSS